MFRWNPVPTVCDGTAILVQESHPHTEGDKYGVWPVVTPGFLGGGGD